MSTKGYAVVTGASAGMGALFAQRLARDGHDLALVARNGAALEALAARLRADTGRSVDVVAADLASEDGLRRVEDLLRGRGDVAMLVNNAGVGSMRPLLDSDAGELTRMIALNVTALTRLTHAALPGMVARGAGTIVNVSSIVAIATEMMNGVYGASKSYVLAFTQALQHELAGKGVRVQAVLPGVTATGFWDTLGHPLARLPADWIMDAGELVDAALAGLRRGEAVTIPGLHAPERWDAHEASRRALATLFGNARPAARYR
ncbi:SDR family oxidoreductase [uncultured Massilia sp.]|uniref:SDR family NAD(P)-dependent oxidoreductase n=1 Tax=uncultured Massilia sp. TaxID=169973 RepID=UPI0025E7BEA4|nr:SDR family oxidoreductase [uncultured Massilia sp.]